MSKPKTCGECGHYDEDLNDVGWTGCCGILEVRVGVGETCGDFEPKEEASDE